MLQQDEVGLLSKRRSSPLHPVNREAVDKKSLKKILDHVCGLPGRWRPSPYDKSTSQTPHWTADLGGREPRGRNRILVILARADVHSATRTSRRSDGSAAGAAALGLARGCGHHGASSFR